MAYPPTEPGEFPVHAILPAEHRPIVPPYEILWCHPKGPSERHLGVVKNSPLFTQGVARGDVISYAPGTQTYVRVEACGGHSALVLWVAFEHACDVGHVEALEVLGCAFEFRQTAVGLIVGLDVPPALAFGEVQRALARWETERGVGIPWIASCDQHRAPRLEAP